MLLTEYRRAGFARVAGTFKEMLRDRMEDRLPKIAAPVLVVRGERDPIVSQAWAKRVAALAPRGHLVVMPGAAHTINRYQADALARTVEPFLLGRQPS